MTIEEIELACEASKVIDVSRHPLQFPEPEFESTFYPMGFPVLLRTNAPEIQALASELWSVFTQQFATTPIRVDVHVEDGDSCECPPAPTVRITQAQLFSIADPHNYSVANFDSMTTQVVVARGTLLYTNYLKYFLLSGAPLPHIATRLATPVHAGCVSFHGTGILLCGDSGAGKSTLSYACARAGWTYVTDDASYLVGNGTERRVTGNCHQIRFRPSAGELFEEVSGFGITPRAAGKPSVELPTALFPGLRFAHTAQVDFLVFLNRRSSGPSQLVPYRKDVARCYFRQVLFGSPKHLLAQYAALDRLLTADIYELRYSDLDWAVHRLQELASEGR